MFNSAMGVMTEPTPLDSGMGKAILEALSEIHAEMRSGIKEILKEVEDIKTDVESIKTTKELETDALMEWKPQLSNSVKAIHGILDSAEKR